MIATKWQYKHNDAWIFSREYECKRLNCIDNATCKSQYACMHDIVLDCVSTYTHTHGFDGWFCINLLVLSQNNLIRAWKCDLNDFSWEERIYFFIPYYIWYLVVHRIVCWRKLNFDTVCFWEKYSPIVTMIIQLCVERVAQRSPAKAVKQGVLRKSKIVGTKCR